jgi:GTPase Era involved in 16S rRNA processing
MLEEHPILNENSSYKLKYLNMLEYFAQKYSANNPWTRQTLRLYIKKILGSEEDYQYGNFNLYQGAKSVLATKFRPFKLFSYRYCLIIDCMFICAYCDKEKSNKIFEELSSLYNKRYHKKLRQVFDSLYDSSVSNDGIEQIKYLKNCWDKNRAFIESKPIKVIVTANMSAGKSTLLNALVGKKVNKTQNEACTAKIHNIVNKPYEDGFCYELDYLLELDADYNTLMEDNADNHGSEITVGTFFRTVNQTSKRLWFIDTPGVNSSQNIEHRLLAENTICNTDSDLLIYLLNGENMGTDDDRKHLLFILEHYHGNILFVVNKLDRFRTKEDSVEETLNAAISDLTDIGFKLPKVVPVSSYAAYLAKMNIFAESLDEYDRDEYELLLRKMKKPEYQLDTYYSDVIADDVHLDCDDESHQLLLHSGLLHLEKIIYNMR